MAGPPSRERSRVEYAHASPAFSPPPALWLIYKKGTAMSVERTREVMNRYFAADHSDVSMMADDVVFTMMATGEETKTPAGVLAMLHHFYHVAFDATADIKNTAFDDGKALVEGDVVGRHIGEFAGIPPTGKEFRVPICVVYDLEHDQIKRARVYLELPILLQQMGATAPAAEPQPFA